MRGRLCVVTVFGTLLTLAHVSYEMAEQDPSNYYTAAVVEFSPVSKFNDALATLRENANAYIEYIEKARQQGADIIVFPEDGLTSLNMPDKRRMDPWTTIIPSALDEYVPCVENDIYVSETLRRLSCAARQNRIYLVVNIAEKEYCSQEEGKCYNGRRFYNTNVVFDRMGKIIARYRKVNLYVEPEFERTKTPEIVTFDTDFGVKFGTFTCFDILFGLPALNLTRVEGISNIVFATAWFSELPFLTAVQTQFGWSFAEDVNLLASGYHHPSIGCAGSGIYLGRDGMANVSMSGNPEHRLLIARVPKTRKSRKQMDGGRKIDSEGEERVTMHHGVAANKPRQGETVDWIRLLHDHVESFESVTMHDSMSKSVCHRDFCCSFHVRAHTDDDSSTTHYRAVVYNGIRLYGTVIEAGVRLCAVIQCSNDSILSCGSAEQSNLTFTQLSITATFGNDYSDTLTMPTVLRSTLLPFQRWSYTERKQGEQTSVTIALNEPTNNLLTFGIYNRDFSKDVWKTAR